jgi:hypothetical protein
MNSLAEFFWAMIMFYFVFMIIWMFIRLFADIFRRQDLTGLWKVIWILVLFWIPFLGAMIYIFSRPKLATDTDVFTAAPAVAAQPAAIGPSTADEIAKLAALRDSGAITPAEFDAAKAKTLAS